MKNVILMCLKIGLKCKMSVNIPEVTCSEIPNNITSVVYSQLVSTTLIRIGWCWYSLKRSIYRGLYATVAA